MDSFKIVFSKSLNLAGNTYWYAWSTCRKSRWKSWSIIESITIITSIFTQSKSRTGTGARTIIEAWNTWNHWIILIGWETKNTWSWGQRSLSRLNYLNLFILFLGSHRKYIFIILSCFQTSLKVWDSGFFKEITKTSSNLRSRSIFKCTVYFCAFP